MCEEKSGRFREDEIPLDKVVTGSYNDFVMKAVGIKVLKARLSEFIRLVRAGETVLVTERDEVVAEIRPAHRQNLPPTTFREALENLAEKGEVTLSSGQLSDWSGFSSSLKGLGFTSKQVIDWIRGNPT